MVIEKEIGLDSTKLVTENQDFIGEREEKCNEKNNRWRIDGTCFWKSD